MTGLLAGLANATVNASTVLILAGLGELISERAGVLNLGVEGMMLVGALTGFVTTVVTGSYWLGLGVAVFAGGLMALIHGFLCISLNSDQAVSGIMLTLLGTGLTTYFGNSYTGNSISGFPERTIPIIGDFLVEIPIIGPAVFQSTATDYIALLLVPLVWLFLYRTNIGLELISVGEDPETADTMGVDVYKMRYLAVVIGGVLAGAAGAHLSLSFNQIWSTGMTAGRGWVAVALVIFARWRPGRILLGAYLFGLFNALQLYSQAFDLTLGPGSPVAGIANPIIDFVMNPTIMSTYPYIVTLLVLVITVVRAENSELAQPSALVQSYTREAD
ncbi:simple sugar transport system permease protein [Halohasta litchfieldiae]|jgi:simple sugar transport system permease protein|uniref:Nucleoside ABC transporter membrane protein n=1 Tax=Halohasta litchfieldiae TaxID=1073996 RepID=A0A1H6RZS3_9EURY|nr:ABC transporter permease [Halohasta litchfieldiae]ATW89349.1 simple sugar transport system permease protein [Halohasta litchfieldiae]SEI59916.1 nucleoside ABC transporter membrane protein [Halohasta litchfieldiae]